MNYIRLWSLPHKLATDNNMKDSRLLLSNIIETLMCRAFQSLPCVELQNLFGSEDFCSTGLNITPPLLQGIALDVSVRSKYISSFLDSSDQQIRSWPSERKRQRDLSRSKPDMARQFQSHWTLSAIRMLYTRQSWPPITASILQSQLARAEIEVFLPQLILNVFFREWLRL
jgi:hypothetical protein